MSLSDSPVMAFLTTEVPLIGLSGYRRSIMVTLASPPPGRRPVAAVEARESGSGTGTLKAESVAKFGISITVLGYLGVVWRR
jgi:hypothetical protein